MERVDLHKKETNVENLIYHLARYKFVMRQLKPSETILEVGCGTGYGSFFLSNYVKKVNAIDIEDDLIDYANKIYQKENIQYQKINLLEDKEFITQNKNKYDTIICFEVIEHLPREQGLQLMKTINSLKKTNGLAYISTPKYLPLNKRTKNRQVHHTHEYTIKELQEDLEKTFSKSIILGQLDEQISSINLNNVWNFYSINF